MAEILVENEICSACGAGVRNGALFCYHCGGSLAPDVVVTENEKESAGGLLKEKKSGNGNGVSKKEVKKAKENINQDSEEATSNLEIIENTPLKSAAALRKRPKNSQKKKIEIVWEEHEQTPNLWFIVVTIILTLFVLGIVWIALYFK